MKIPFVSRRAYEEQVERARRAEDVARIRREEIHEQRLEDLRRGLVLAGAHGASRSAWREIERPLTALALNAPLLGQFEAGKSGSGQGYKTGGVTAGAVLSLPVVSLPIGMDIKSVTCTAADVDAGWLALNFTFGTLNLVNPQGTFGGVNLSMFDPRVSRDERLAPWILSKTKVDVQVTAQLQNGAYVYYAQPPRFEKVKKPRAADAPEDQPDEFEMVKVAPLAGCPAEAIFHGFSINAFQEEQVCAISTRIEPTDRNVGSAELIRMFRWVISQQRGVGYDDLGFASPYRARHVASQAAPPPRPPKGERVRRAIVEVVDSAVCYFKDEPPPVHAPAPTPAPQHGLSWPLNSISPFPNGIR